MTVVHILHTVCRRWSHSCSSHEARMGVNLFSIYANVCFYRRRRHRQRQRQLQQQQQQRWRRWPDTFSLRSLHAKPVNFSAGTNSRLHVKTDTTDKRLRTPKAYVHTQCTVHSAWTECVISFLISYLLPFETRTGMNIQYTQSIVAEFCFFLLVESSATGVCIGTIANAHIKFSFTMLESENGFTALYQRDVCACVHDAITNTNNLIFPPFFICTYGTHS